MISIQMLKLSGYLESGTFSSEQKKANLVPVHKKGDKQYLKVPYDYFLFVK